MVQIINEYNDTPDTQPILPNCFNTTYQNAEEQGYFNFTIYWVGTPFPKIGEMDYSNSGLEFATGGEDLINWALLRLVDALSYSIDPSHKRLDDNVAKEHIPLYALLGLWLVKWIVAMWLTPPEKLHRTVRASQSAPAKRKAVYLRIFPWQREARTFVNWLTRS